MQVGVYYASNAVGRLVGTLSSGAIYSYVGTPVQGFGACLFASVAFSAISAFIDVFLYENRPGASWLSPFNRCLPGVQPPGDIPSETLTAKDEIRANNEIRVKKAALAAEEDAEAVPAMPSEVVMEGKR
jgi:hypothetical protein